jgi:hypothetical protein
MKSKLKRTHHQQQYPIRPHSKTFSILPIRHNSNDQDRRISEYATMNNEYRFSTPPLRNSTLSINPLLRRSLKHHPKYSTQSTSESKTTQSDLPMITSIYASVDDDETTRTILDIDAQPSITSL